MPKLALRSTVFAGIAIIVIFFGSLIAWSLYAPLSSAAIAPGQVTVDQNSKTVQHLENGVVSEILVKEGQQVAAGEVLIRLAGKQAKASKQRLEAQIEADAKQFVLILDEIKDIGSLVKKGLARKTRLTALERGRAQIEGRMIQAKAQLEVASDEIVRLEIKSPVKGVVTGLQIHTVGGVIRGGQILMNIVPIQNGLIVEARVNVRDIDAVYQGLAAKIYLTSYSRRKVAPIYGEVRSISADRLVDEYTGKPYYLALIDIEYPENLDLRPGMPAEVMIITGERAAIDYFLDPFTSSFNRAFREE